MGLADNTTSLLKMSHHICLLHAEPHLRVGMRIGQVGLQGPMA